MQPKTWNEAANFALETIEFEEENHDFGHLVWETVYENDWILLAAGALRNLKNRGTWDRAKFLELFAGKHHDYGTRNILKFGVQGVKVRLWDKIARLENLAGKDPKHEAIDETFVDMIGYPIINIMLHMGWFELPLEGS